MGRSEDWRADERADERQRTVRGEEMTEEQMQEAIKLMDVDGSGEVDFDEFSNWWSVYQFQQRHRPDDPVIAHYRTVFDQMAKELAEAGTSDPDAKQAKVMAVMQGQGVINKAAFLKLCAALGRPLYAHETEAAVKKVTASTKNITFEIFMMFFDDLQASDGALLMMFEAVDVDVSVSSRDWICTRCCEPSRSERRAVSPDQLL